MAFSPTYVYKIWGIYLKPFLRYEGVPKFKVGHVTPPTPLVTQFWHFYLGPIALHILAKFEVIRFDHSWDMSGSRNFKVGHVIPRANPSDILYIFFIYGL